MPAAPTGRPAPGAGRRPTPQPDPCAPGPRQLAPCPSRAASTPAPPVPVRSAGAPAVIAVGTRCPKCCTKRRRATRLTWHYDRHAVRQRRVRRSSTAMGAEWAGPVDDDAAQRVEREVAGRRRPRRRGDRGGQTIVRRETGGCGDTTRGDRRELPEAGIYRVRRGSSRRRRTAQEELAACAGWRPAPTGAVRDPRGARPARDRRAPGLTRGSSWPSPTPGCRPPKCDLTCPPVRPTAAATPGPTTVCSTSLSPWPTALARGGCRGLSGRRGAEMPAPGVAQVEL